MRTFSALRQAWLTGITIGLCGCLLWGGAVRAEDDLAVADEEEEFPSIHLRLGHTSALNHSHNKAAEQFAREVREKTGGRVIIDIFPNFELGDQESLVEQVNLGGVDMCIATHGNTGTFVPRLNALTAPYLFNDYAHSHRVIDNFLLRWENEALEEFNLHALAIFDYGFRHLTTKGKAIYDVNDLKGMVIRVPNYRGLKLGLEEMGAETKSVAYFYLYQALASGTVTAQDNPLDTILSDGLYAVQDHLSLTFHYLDTQNLLINYDLYSSFSRKLQKVLTDAATNAMMLTRELIANRDELTLSELQRKGFKVNDVRRSSFKARLHKTYEELAKASSEENMAQLQEAVRRFE